MSDLLSGSALHVVAWLVVVCGCVVVVGVSLCAAIWAAWRFVVYCKYWPMLRVGLAYRLHGEGWNRRMFWTALNSYIGDSASMADSVVRHLRAKFPNAGEESL
jgi:hypothetical protein